MAKPHDDEKELAAEAAVSLIRDGMRVGLGTGTTVEHLLPLLPGHARNVTYAASSPRTEQTAREFGLNIQPFETVDRLDLTIDGADQVEPTRWLVKEAAEPTPARRSSPPPPSASSSSSPRTSSSRSCIRRSRSSCSDSE